VRDRWDSLAAAGASGLVVSFEAVAQLEPYRERLRLPFPIAADPRREAYHAYGLTRARFWRIWGGRTLWAYARLIARGWRPRRSTEGVDLSQLGGDFVIDETGTLRYVHVSRHPADRPAVQELAAALERPLASR
jgi:peroxiredoxin